MYLLPCSCGHALAISPGQAGDLVNCPQCQQSVQVPLLRDLRQLPQAPEEQPLREAAPGNFFIRVLFGLSGFVALIAAGFATFALFSAMAVKITADTEEHIELDRSVLLNSSPSDLVDRWSEMSRTPLVERRPFFYQQEAMRKARWQRHMIVGYSVAALAILLAAGLGIIDSRQRGATRHPSSSSEKPPAQPPNGGHLGKP